MRIEIMADGRILEGTPVQIAQGMRELVFDGTVRRMSVGEYVDWAADSARQMTGAALDIAGESDEEKAASFVEQMLAQRLARRA